MKALGLGLVLLTGAAAAQDYDDIDLDALFGCKAEKAEIAALRERDAKLREIIASDRAKFEQLRQYAIKLRDEGEALRDANASREEERAVRQATIAAACDYIIRLCPDSVADPGRRLLETGDYGAGGLTFWGLVAAKATACLTALGSLFLLLWFGIGWFYLHVSQPKRAAVEHAQATVRDARSAAFSAEERARDAEHRLAELSSETTEQHARLDVVLEQIERAQRELETLKAARAAISGL